jgi:hypothetical protein
MIVLLSGLKNDLITLKKTATDKQDFDNSD